MNSKLLFTIALAIAGLSANAQNSWSPKTNFAGVGRKWATGFSIGTKGYIGMGDDGAVPTPIDFWEYDFVANTWTQKADFAGATRKFAVGFSINAKGYVGTGRDAFGTYFQDFWEYNPSNNIWTVKANFPGGLRSAAVGFSIGNKGYIGTGWGGSFNNDFYEYDPTTDSWTVRAPFGGTARQFAVGFSIGTKKGYIGTGTDGTGYKKDFWEYDQSNNLWTQKTNFSGVAREQAVGFSIGNKGYIGTGWDASYKQDFWEYNQSTDVWTSKTNYLSSIYGAVGFSTCTKGYIGTGYSGNYQKSFTEYTPSVTPSAAFTASQTNFCVNSCINFTDVSTNVPTNWAWTFSGGTPSSSTLQNPTNICYSATGTYTATLTASNMNCTSTTSQAITVITIPIAPQIPSGPSTVVNPQSYSYSIPSVPNTTYYKWTVSSGSVTSGQGTTNITYTAGASSGTVTICVADSNSCGISAQTCLLVNNVTAISENNIADNFTIYPNPTSGKFILDSKIIRGEISVYNVFGEKIYSEKINSAKSEIDLSKQQNGIYFVHLKIEQGTAVKKIIVNK